MSRPKELPSSTFASGNYGAGANPWNGAAKRVAPTNYYFTPNTKIPAEEMNSVIGVLWDAVKGMLTMQAIQAATNFPHHFDMRDRAILTTLPTLMPPKGFGGSWDDAQYGSGGYIEESVTSATQVRIPLDLKPGSIIHQASVYLTGSSSGVISGITMPTIQIKKQSLSSGSFTALGSPVSDGSANEAAFETRHILTSTLINEVVDPAYAYCIIFDSGSGGNKAAGLRLYTGLMKVSDAREGARSSAMNTSVITSSIVDVRHTISDPDGVAGTWWLLATSETSTEYLLKSRDGGATWDFVFDGSSLAVDGSSLCNLIEGWGTDELWLTATAGGSFRKYVPSTNTWSNVSAPVASTTWYDSAYFSGGNVLIVLGKNGTTPKLATYNGTSWTDRSASIGGTWAAPGAVCCSPTVALVWYDTNLYTSSNGTAWTSRTAPDSLRCICYSSTMGKFVALADTDIYTSSDGINWTSMSAAPTTFSSIAASGAVLLAVAAQTDANDYQHWYSVDEGVTWARATDFRQPNGDYWTTPGVSQRNGAYFGKLAASVAGDQIASFSSVRASFGLKG